MNETLQISFQNSQPLLLEFFQSPLKNTDGAGTKWETGEIWFGFLVDTVVACPNKFFFLIGPIT